MASCTAALRDVAPAAALPDLDGALSLPLDRLLERVGAGLAAGQRAELAAAFVRHYDSEGWRAAAPYSGVPEVLETLYARGVRLYVVTNKRRRPAERILEGTRMAAAIAGVYARDDVPSTSGGKTGLGAACLAAQRIDPADALAVGDSREDEDMAEALGMSFAAVTWGYSGPTWPYAVGGVARTDNLRVRGQLPIYAVLSSIDELVTLVLPRRSRRSS
jgi:phosphoglycolate phosphatase